MDYAAAMQAVSDPYFVARISAMRIPLNSKWERLVWAGFTCARDARLTVVEAMGHLPEASAAVLLARFGEGLTLAQYGQRIERSRERVRQMEAKALRQLRNKLQGELAELREAIKVVPVPGGPFDPAWVPTEEAAELTELTEDHIRWLCRESKVISKRYDHNLNRLAISRPSLKAYVLGTATNGRRRGIWKGNDDA